MNHPQHTQEIVDTPAVIAAPDWAPDNAAPAVVKLIVDEQYLEDLGLRGLSSADSAELHQGVRNLQRQLGEAFQKGIASRGWRRPAWLFIVYGWLVGVLCGAWVISLVVGLPL